MDEDQFTGLAGARVAAARLGRPQPSALGRGGERSLRGHDVLRLHPQARRVLVDRDVRTREPGTNRRLGVKGDAVGAGERHGVIQLQVQLDDRGLARLAGTQPMNAAYPGDGGGPLLEARYLRHHLVGECHQSNARKARP